MRRNTMAKRMEQTKNDVKQEEVWARKLEIEFRCPTVDSGLLRLEIYPKFIEKNKDEYSIAVVCPSCGNSHRVVL
jgi:transcription elongation factor Elf1